MYHPAKRRRPVYSGKNLVSLASTVKKGYDFYRRFKKNQKQRNPNKQRQRDSTKLTHKLLRNLISTSRGSRNYGGCYVTPNYRPIYRMGYGMSSAFVYARRKDVKDIAPWHVSRNTVGSQHSCNLNECAYFYKVVGSVAPEVDDLSKSYKYKNATGEVTADLSTLYNCKMAIKGKGIVTLKNNSGLDVHATYYVARYKDNTNVTPTGALQEGLTDYTNGLVTNPERNINFYANNSKGFNRLFRVLRKRSVCIEPGKTVKIHYETPFMLYDPQDQDRFNTAYASGFTTICLVRIQGQVAHDLDDTTKVGYSAGILDVIEEKHYRYGFKTRNEIKQASFTNTLGAFGANGAVGANEEGDEMKDDPV